jgi:hypothetical protein
MKHVLLFFAVMISTQALFASVKYEMKQEKFTAETCPLRKQASIRLGDSTTSKMVAKADEERKAGRTKHIK